ncbi:MAG: glycosyltransferase family 2 protein [Patescibacteria group bacterium]|nr:MAG: glycosyltransferase family 2 protein [Patescibacteria group bacterium]
MVDVSIVIVNYKTRGMVRQGLKSLRLARIRLNYEVFVVDNASGDGLPELVRAEFPEVRLIALDRNVGFAAGNNAAMRKAKGKYVFVLNPDALVPEGAIESMYAYMEAHPDIGVLGPKLVRPDGTRQESVHRFPTPWIPIYRRTPLGKTARAKSEIDRYFLRDVDMRETSEVDWVEGAAMFVRRAAIDAVGMFDERFFVYFEDTDWCRRFWGANWKVVYHPKIAIIHYHRRESADTLWFLAPFTNKVSRIHITSAIAYFLKWKNRPLPRIGAESS